MQVAPDSSMEDVRHELELLKAETAANRATTLEALKASQAALAAVSTAYTALLGKFIEHEEKSASQLGGQKRQRAATPSKSTGARKAQASAARASPGAGKTASPAMGKGKGKGKGKGSPGAGKKKATPVKEKKATAASKGPLTTEELDSVLLQFHLEGPGVGIKVQHLSKLLPEWTPANLQAATEQLEDRGMLIQDAPGEYSLL